MPIRPRDEPFKTAARFKLLIHILLWKYETGLKLKEWTIQYIVSSTKNSILCFEFSRISQKVPR